LTLFSSQAGLFSSVLSAFVFPKIQDLKVNPADQLVYYQQQSVQILAQISQQIAAIGTQTSTNPTALPPYPTFHPPTSDRRVNILWLLSLVCSLSAALLATLVQQWVRAYMRVYQQSSNPLKTARIRLFLFEGVRALPVVAESVPVLLHLSLVFFFWGLGGTIKHIDTTVYAMTMVPIAICGFLYLYFAISPLWNLQSPFRTPVSAFIWYLIQKLPPSLFNNRSRKNVARPLSMEARQEEFAMKPTKDRRDRDVRGVRWLVDNIDGSNETETFVLAIPGFVKQEWGQEVWNVVLRDDAQSTTSTSVQVGPYSGLPYISRGSTIRSLWRCVRDLLNTYNDQGSAIYRGRRMPLYQCIETAAVLACCTDVQLDSFGEIGKMLSELGHNERTNELPTIKYNPLFTIRWTCLSLVSIRQMIGDKKLQDLAKLAVSGIARLQSDYGPPDAVAGLRGAQKIDEHLKKAWENVKDLRLAFEPWGPNRTEEEIRETLHIHNGSISELERIGGEVGGMEDIDWRISLLQDAMDEVTHKLIRRLPSVFFDELKLPGPALISEAFNFPLVGATPVPPRLIFPGQQVQSLCTLGRKLREIVDKPNPERLLETLESLQSTKISVSLPQHISIKRQLWRLLDIRDGNGLGFTIELFFLALKGLSSSYSSPEFKRAFYTGTFKAITSQWESSKDSIGTQRILLDLICDLVIQGRGVFSDFSYPDYIVYQLLKLVQRMIDGHKGSRSHIDEAIGELRNGNARNVRDADLRELALNTIDRF